MTKNDSKGNQFMVGLEYLNRQRMRNNNFKIKKGFKMKLIK